MASKQVEPPTPSEIFSKYRGPLPSGPVLDSGIEDGMDWEEYEGIEKNTEEAGTIHYTYEEDADHGISQYSIRPDGYERTLYKDGRRAQLNVDGSVLEIHPDGRKIQINPNGDRMEKVRALSTRWLILTKECVGSYLMALSFVLMKMEQSR